jgi:predicted nucleic acid-binding protein
MVVIADSSPLVALTNIGHVDVLPTLFGQAARRTEPWTTWLACSASASMA